MKTIVLSSEMTENYHYVSFPHPIISTFSLISNDGETLCCRCGSCWFCCGGGNDDDGGGNGTAMAAAATAAIDVIHFCQLNVVFYKRY